MKLRLKLTLDFDVPVNWDKEDFEELTINEFEEKYKEELIEYNSYFINDNEKKRREHMNFSYD